MIWFWILISVIALILLFFCATFICFVIAFYSKPRKKCKDGKYPLPRGKIYKPLYPQLIAWIKSARSLKSEKLEITSFDGLKLRGKYYEYKKGAPIEILFHGYRGNGERDLSAGIERCFLLERNVLIVDQRACGASEGRFITFGIKERYDCIKWAEFVAEKFNNEVPIIISGVSMGAATVLMCCNQQLPSSVKCILADCGFTSPKEIIKKVIKDLKLPVKIFYPLIKLGAKLFGRFDIENCSPLECVKQSKLPIIYIHGKTDAFVPAEMSLTLYENTASKKSLLLIDNAGHGLAFPIDKKSYLSAIKDFEKEWK